jgi:hypothetical protein
MEGEAGPSSAPATSAEKRTGYRLIQKRTWDFLDDPGSSTAAKYWMQIMMCIILLSIATFTVASNPEKTWYTDVWVNTSTGAVLASSNASDCGSPQCYKNDGPSYLTTELNENRTPFYEIETFCIMVFTVEFILRLATASEGPGVVAFVTNPANIIDLISILPWYIELMFSGGGLGVLGVLRLIRLTRITRIFKMSKNFQGLVVLFATLRKSAAALLMLFAFMAIFSILFATLIFNAEQGDYDPSASSTCAPTARRRPSSRSRCRSGGRS